ncbi:MAG TPA: bis(5'-nucleosyl)-tetraphosphatase PrpE [Bacillus sp. (in: firmicutes)]|uniref:bis(5'-nucleosyl)-tetraphosphatase PrpE n=1 Tax=Bacillus litorisediminis TaxID=2922713 RepID=UPI001FAE42D9|nr:bis(5'-nucleosyl)-tetraphosphatase PrpE [Bacillus litorisediminis]HWO77522.1 bis(5'-nucleosyl)-tetraphosphatase PrpE [Bacillus sp. (in: firmicutes)]
MKIDIIGDIHGCYDEFVRLTKKLKYTWESGIPIHPQGRKLAFIGDLTDRGPNSLQVVEIVYTLVCEKKNAIYVPGNHCNKLYRYFLGNKVQITHGLETTVAEWQALDSSKQNQIKQKFIELYEQAPLYQLVDDGNLILAHAGIKESLIGKYNSKVKTFVLYGDITGETDESGRPVRRDWASHYTGKAWIVYGHTPVKEVRKINRTYNIDTGAVFGNKLSSLRYPEMEIVDVESSMPYIEDRFRPFE